MYIAVYKYLYEGREMAKKSQHFNDYFKYPLKYSFFFFSFYFFFFSLFWLFCAAWGILIPQPGIKPAPLQWKHSTLTTGRSEKSLLFLFIFEILMDYIRP